MSFVNGSLVVQGIQVNIATIGSVKQGPFSIPFSTQYSSTVYVSGDTAIVSIPAGFNGVLVAPNNADMMGLNFELGNRTPIPAISPEYVTVITFDPNEYPDVYNIAVSSNGGELVNVVLF